MSFIFNLFSSNENDQVVKKDVLEDVENLCDRIKTSTLSNDRLASLESLKNLSKENKLQVGTAMDSIIECMSKHRLDEDILRISFEILFEILKPNNTNDINDLGTQFSEIFLKHIENLSFIFELIDIFNMNIKWACLRLLIILARSQLVRLQQYVLQLPLGLSKVISCLKETNEIIVNDTILFLTYLTFQNQAIQKILVFENIFEILFSLIENDAYNLDNIINQDILSIFENLLDKNIPNQKTFKELNFLPKLVPFYEVNSLESNWSHNKVLTINSNLNILKTLLGIFNNKQNINASRTLINQCGILSILLRMLFLKEIPDSLLINVLETVGDVIRGHDENQKKFWKSEMDFQGKQRKVFIYLWNIINNRRAIYSISKASLYCLLCFIHKNKNLDDNIIKILFDEDSEMGQKHFITAFTSPDSFVIWCVCIFFSKLIYKNKQCCMKMCTLEVGSENKINLISYLITIIQGELFLQAKVGAIYLLVSLFISLPMSINHFLNDDKSLSILLSSSEEGSSTIMSGLINVLFGSILIAVNKLGNGAKYSLEVLKHQIQIKGTFDEFYKKLSRFLKNSDFVATLNSQRILGDNSDSVLFEYSLNKIILKVEKNVYPLLFPSNDRNATLETTIKNLNEELDKTQAELTAAHGYIFQLQERLCMEQNLAISNEIEQPKSTFDTSQFYEIALQKGEIQEDPNLAFQNNLSIPYNMGYTYQQPQVFIPDNYEYGYLNPVAIPKHAYNLYENRHPHSEGHQSPLNYYNPNN